MYTPIQNSSFAGTYNSAASAPFSASVCQYAAQALYQHIQAYFEEIIPDLAGQFSSPSFTSVQCGELRLYCLSLG